MQRDNNLVEQTNGIYQRLGKVHFLNVTDKNGKISVRKLRALFKLTFVADNMEFPTKVRWGAVLIACLEALLKREVSLEVQPVDYP